jgi:hypothetical protein
MDADQAPTDGYVAVESRDWSRMHRLDVARRLKDPFDFTLVKLRASMLSRDTGMDILQTTLTFAGEKGGERTAVPELRWEGFWGRLLQNQLLFAQIGNKEGTMQVLRDEQPNLSGQGQPLGREVIEKSGNYMELVRRHQLFYDAVDAGSGRYRLRLKSKFVDALYAKDGSFAALRDEMHYRGFHLKLDPPINHETWTLFVVFGGASDQEFCQAHQDAGTQRGYYITNIIPLTVDPEDAGGTVVANKRGDAGPDTDLAKTRFFSKPVNQYGYAFCFRNKVWHYGTCNTTKTPRIYLMQVCSQFQDPNDKGND